TSDARIEVYARPNKDVNEKELSKDEMKKVLDQYYLFSIGVENNELKAVAKPKDGTPDEKRSVIVSFKIFIPGNVSTNLSTKGGPIYLSHLNGTQNFSTSGGQLVLKDLSGKVYGKTSGGSITISNSKDDVELSTSGGSIDAITAPAISLCPHQEAQLN
ncbi:MAG: hypothetical protein ICV66_07525, partial [Chitinophagaceae bacterium]|nr:hypothetical protein [Chitinophagaceae bacterium]